MNAMDVALICKALGDANRLEIVKMLSDGEKCGCKLLERFEITQPTLSHHMKILMECGLVNARKDGKWQHYSLNCETLTQFKEFIEGLTCCGGSCTPEAMQAAEAEKKESGIKILGGGCAKCNALEAATVDALRELGMDTTIDHVRDFEKIAAYGVMTTPALVVDGQVVSYGKVLKKDEVIVILKKVRA